METVPLPVMGLHSDYSKNNAATFYNLFLVILKSVDLSADREIYLVQMETIPLPVNGCTVWFSSVEVNTLEVHGVPFFNKFDIRLFSLT